MNEQPDTLNVEGGAAVRCSAWLGHPPRTPMKRVQAGNKLCFGFLICRVSFLLAFLVWACPLVEAGGLVVTDGCAKSVNQPVRDKVPHLQCLRIQLGCLSQFGTEHKITRRFRVNPSAQNGQKTPEPLPLDGRIATNPNPLPNQNTDESDEQSCENLINHWWWLAVVFLSGVAIGYLWPGWPNDPSSAKARP